LYNNNNNNRLLHGATTDRHTSPIHIYTADLAPIVADHARSHYYVVWQHTIRYDKRV